MNDDRLAARDAHRAARRTTRRPHIERDVTDRIVGHPRSGAVPADSHHTPGLAREAEAEVAETTPVRGELEAGWNVFGRMGVVDYLFCAVYLLVGLRLATTLLGASPASAPVRVISALTGPLCAPFRALVGIPATDGGQTLALPILIALVGYMLAHATISGLMRAARPQRALTP